MIYYKLFKLFLIVYCIFRRANGLDIGWNDVTLQVEQDSTVFVHHSVEPNVSFLVLFPTAKSCIRQIDNPLHLAP